MSSVLQCPRCRNPVDADVRTCSHCGRSFNRVFGFLDFTGRLTEDSAAAFSSSMKEMQLHVESELRAGRRMVREWLVPILSARGIPQGSRVVSVGCGVGEDVAALRDMGYEAYGVDLGFRILSWVELRRDPRWFFVGDGADLPLRPGAVDAAMAIGVIEHVGTVGDSAELLPDWLRIRRTFCAELARVARRAVLITTPNRAFPIDLQHRVSRGRFARALGDRTGLYFHSPRDPFLVSYGDVDEFFAGVGSGRSEALPLHGYFGFNIRHSRPYLGRLSSALRLYLRLVDHLPGVLRKSGLNPYVLALVSVNHRGS